MVEPNIEASVDKLNLIWASREHEGAVKFHELREIISALRTPVAQELPCTCKFYGYCPVHSIKPECEHVWADYVFSETLRCRKCNVPKPTDVKPSETLYSKIMEELKQPKDLTLGKSDIHAIVERARYTAERHYEPIIAAAKEEGRKEGIKQVYERIKPIFIGKETI